MVTGTFPGTNTYCPASNVRPTKPIPGVNNNFKLGSCSSKDKGRFTVQGMSPAKLTSFDGMSFCVKRNPDLTYHAVSKLRSAKGDSDCSSANLCGSPSDKDRRFCLKAGEQCPLNALLTIENTTTIDPAYTSEKSAMNI